MLSMLECVANVCVGAFQTEMHSVGAFRIQMHSVSAFYSIVLKYNSQVEMHCVGAQPCAATQ